MNTWFSARGLARLFLVTPENAVDLDIHMPQRRTSHYAVPNSNCTRRRNSPVFNHVIKKASIGTESVSKMIIEACAKVRWIGLLRRRRKQPHRLSQIFEWTEIFSNHSSARAVEIQDHGYYESHEQCENRRSEHMAATSATK